MFGNLAEITATLHSEISQFFWILLPPLFCLKICMELFKRDQPNPVDAFRRLVVTLILLWTFEPTVDAIASVSEELLSRISPHSNAWAVLADLGPTDDRSLFDVKSHMIYALAMISYLVAYLGFFMAEAVTQFLWAILYVVSPLMILCNMFSGTSAITTSLYKSLCRVATWKVLWTILGAMLLSLVDSNHLRGMEEFLRTIVVNFCIGIAMLLVPFSAKSLLGDGMESATGTAVATQIAFAKAKGLKSIAKITKLKTPKIPQPKKELYRDPIKKHSPRRPMDKTMQRSGHPQKNPGPAKPR